MNSRTDGDVIIPLGAAVRPGVASDNPDHGPMLVLGGELDHTVPTAIVKRIVR